MRKMFLTVLVLGISLLGSVAGAQTYGVNVFVDNNAVTFPDQRPYIDSNDRTLVPIRFIAEEMGAEVDWDGTKQLVTIDKGNTTIELTIGERRAKVNGTWKTFDTSAILHNSRTMVPLRFVSETLGADVDWVGSSKTVYIWTGKVPKEPIPQNPAGEKKTTSLTEADIQRLRSYPFDRKTNDYVSFDDYLKINDGFDVNYAIRETTEIIEKNWYRGAQYYPNAEAKFFADERTVYRHFQGYRGVRGILQIKFKGTNKEGLEPGKLYERDMEYQGRLSALDSQTIGWRIDFVVPLSDYKEIKE